MVGTVILVTVVNVTMQVLRVKMLLSTWNTLDLAMIQRYREICSLGQFSKMFKYTIDAFCHVACIFVSS